MKPKLFSVKDQEIAESAINNGFLCALNTKAWGNTKKIPIEKMKLLANTELSSWIRSNKSLIDHKALEGINAKITRARNVTKSHALPFPIESVYLIPKDRIEALGNELDEIIEELKYEVEEFAKDYDKFIEQARNELKKGEFFNPNEYPRNIKERFDISYRFLKMGVPDEVKEISPAIYQKEVVKFQNLMEDTRNKCIIFLRESFIKELSVIVEALTGEAEDGKAKRIREDTMNKVEKFFEMFKSKNIFNDKDLLNKIEEARKIMIGIEASDLRSSDKLKELIAEQMTKVAEEVNNGIVKYKRMVSF